MEQLPVDIEEKLEKALEFIRSIEKMNKKDYDVFNIVDLKDKMEGECLECGSDDIELHGPYSSNISLNTEYIDSKVIDDLKDKAWHVLFDLTN